MNLTDYTYLLSKPDAINDRYNESLDKIIANFPYFQSARVLQLKHLYNQNSFKYNTALKTTAIHTTDRNVLFDFITTNQFQTISNELYNQKLEKINNIDVIDLEIIETKTPSQNNSLKNSIEKSITKAANSSNKELLEKLEIGKPLQFSPTEKHSFQEWLQLSRINPIQRTEPNPEINTQKQRKIELIDKFIEANPKIPPITKNNTTPINPINTEDKSYLMTETLAKVYLEQKKYSKAIQAYQILILKYPEKSSLFATQIEDIKNLQQNNNLSQ